MAEVEFTRRDTAENFKIKKWERTICYMIVMQSALSLAPHTKRSTNKKKHKPNHNGTEGNRVVRAKKGMATRTETKEQNANGRVRPKEMWITTLSTTTERMKAKLHISLKIIRDASCNNINAIYSGGANLAFAAATVAVAVDAENGS